MREYEDGLSTVRRGLERGMKVAVAAHHGVNSRPLGGTGHRVSYIMAQHILEGGSSGNDDVATVVTVGEENVEKERTERERRKKRRAKRKRKKVLERLQQQQQDLGDDDEQEDGAGGAGGTSESVSSCQGTGGHPPERPQMRSVDVLRTEVEGMLQRHRDATFAVSNHEMTRGGDLKLTTAISEEVRAIRRTARDRHEAVQMGMMCMPQRGEEPVAGADTTPPSPLAARVLLGTAASPCPSVSACSSVGRPGTVLDYNSSGEIPPAGLSQPGTASVVAVSGSAAAAAVVASGGANGPSRTFTFPSGAHRKGSSAELIASSTSAALLPRNAAGREAASGASCEVSDSTAGGGLQSQAFGISGLGEEGSELGDTNPTLASDTGADGDGTSLEVVIVGLRRKFEEWVVKLGSELARDGSDAGGGSGSGAVMGGSTDLLELVPNISAADLVRGPQVWLDGAERLQKDPDLQRTVRNLVMDARAKSSRRLDVEGAVQETRRMQARKARKAQFEWGRTCQVERTLQESRERYIGSDPGSHSGLPDVGPMPGSSSSPRKGAALTEAERQQRRADTDSWGTRSGKMVLRKRHVLQGTRYDKAGSEGRRKVVTAEQKEGQERRKRRMRYGAWYLPRSVWQDALADRLPSVVLDEQIQRVLGKTHSGDGSRLDGSGGVSGGGLTDVEAADGMASTAGTSTGSVGGGQYHSRMAVLQRQQEERDLDEQLKRSYVTFVLKNHIERTGGRVPDWLKDVKVDMTAGLPSFALEVLSYDERSANANANEALTPSTATSSAPDSTSATSRLRARMLLENSGVSSVESVRAVTGRSSGSLQHQ